METLTIIEIWEKSMGILLVFLSKVLWPDYFFSHLELFSCKKLTRSSMNNLWSMFSWGCLEVIQFLERSVYEHVKMYVYVYHINVCVCLPSFARGLESYLWLAATWIYFFIQRAVIVQASVCQALAVLLFQVCVVFTS